MATYAAAAYTPRAWTPAPDRRRWKPGRRFGIGLAVVIVALYSYTWAQDLGYLPAWANVGAAIGAASKPSVPVTAYPTFGSTELVNYLEASMVEQDTKIDVSYWAHRDGIDAVMDAATEAYVQSPYVFTAGGQYRDTGSKVYYEPAYLYANDEADRRRAATLHAAQAGVAASGAATAGTTADKVAAIHDYIVGIADYDYGAYDLINAGEYSSDQVAQSQQAFGIFDAGTAVCNGYAQAFQAMADAAGLESIQVTGTVSSGMTVGNHAWNKVLVDGRWLVVDTTWDDPLPGEAPQRDYLMISPSDPLLSTRVQDLDWVVDAEAGRFT